MKTAYVLIDRNDEFSPVLGIFPTYELAAECTVNDLEWDLDDVVIDNICFDVNDFIN
jgi:hypothetical protein